MSDLDESGRRRFDRECVAMGSLSWHPNVVALFDSGIAADGHPWLAMEYLEAGSLGDRLRKDGPLPWPAAVVAGVQVAGALGAAHAAGVLHRDLKPENLLIGPFGEVELGDFGIAAVEGASRTTTGHASFTASHVAPEILRRQRPDERADLYSLASTLHTLVAGSPPFAGQAGEPIEAVLASVLTDPPPRLQGVPASLADLLQQTLSKDPRDRPASAEVFGRILQRVQAEGGKGVTELRLAPTGNVTPAVDPPTAVPAPTGGDLRPTVHRSPPSPPRGDPLPTVVAAPSPPEEAAARRPRAERPDSPPRASLPPRSRQQARRRRTIVGAMLGVATLAAVLLVATRGGDDGGTPSSDTTVPAVSAANGATATTATDTDTSSGGTTAATTVDPAELRVLVENASGVSGAATAMTTTLQADGYSGALEPSGNAQLTDVTVIYYVADGDVSYQGDAEAVAIAIGAQPTQVEPMPADAADELGVDTQDADVVVMLGADLAPGFTGGVSGYIVIPDVRGQSEDDAQRLLDGLGFVVSIERVSGASADLSGTVTAQSPAADTALASGSIVTITVAE